MADLEKIHIERSGANLTLPSPHHGHEKVLIHTCIYIFKKYFMLIFMFKFLHYLLIYQYRFWRDNCLWINFVKSNSTVFWIIFPVDLSLTLWLLLTLQVKYIPFKGSYIVFYFIFWVLFFLVQNVLAYDWFVLWMFNFSFFSLKWKSLESRFFTLHWSFWPVEFLSTGKTVHPLVLSIGFLLFFVVCVCVCFF